MTADSMFILIAHSPASGFFVSSDAWKTQSEAICAARAEHAAGCRRTYYVVTAPLMATLSSLVAQIASDAVRPLPVHRSSALEKGGQS